MVSAPGAVVLTPEVGVGKTPVLRRGLARVVLIFLSPQWWPTGPCEEQDSSIDRRRLRTITQNADYVAE